MKKKIFALLLICFSFVLVAQEKIYRVQILTPDLENISEKDSTWLSGQIQDKLKENLQDYAKFITVVDDSNEKVLKDLQKKSESSSFDEKTIIEAGYISSAAYAVFTTVRKASSVYTIGLNFMDLKTGLHETVTSSGKKSLEDLFDVPGCALDEVTEKLCEKLKISLTSAQKYVLMHGRAELSVNDQILMAKQDRENYEKQLRELDKQISSLKISSDLNSQDVQKKIEAEKALLQEKQISADRRMKELSEIQKKKVEDAKKEQERSIEVIQKRSEIEKKAQKKAEEARKLKIEKETILGKISVIENKKKALIEIRDSVNERVEEIQNQAKTDVVEIENEINSREYKKIELKNGEPIAEAVERRKNEIEVQKQNIYKKSEEDIKKSKATTQKLENELFKEIHNDYKKIQGKQTVSSFGDELKFSYGPYDAEEKAWPVSIYLYCLKILITEEKIYVKYSELSGKNPPELKTASDKELLEYSNDVDMYDSLLSRGSEIIYYEMDYHVVPEPDNKPSTYKFYFDELRVYDTIKKSVISRPKLSAKTRERTMSPVYDIRTEKVIDSDSKKTQKKVQNMITYDQSVGGGGMTGLYASFGADLQRDFVFDINGKLAFTPYFFGFFGGGMGKLPESLQKNSDGKNMGYLDCGLGFNWRPSLLFLHPSFYISGGCGLAYNKKVTKTISYSKYSKYSTTTKKTEISSNFFWVGEGGLEIPFGKHFSIFGEARIFYFMLEGYSYSFSAGVGLIKL